MLRDFQSEWGDQLKLIRVNADENLRLASAYQIKSLPTLLLFEDGKVVYRLEGFNGREELRLALQKLPLSVLPRSA